MKYGPKQIRHVQYVEDGCDEYECLHCKERWQSRTACIGFWEGKHEDLRWKHCPYCGVAWESVCSWDERRKWDHHHGACWLNRAEAARTERLQVMQFTMQRRLVPFDWEKDGEPGDWEYHYGRFNTAHEAYRSLKTERAEDAENEKEHGRFFGSFEFRVVPVENKYPYQVRKGVA